MTSLGKLKWMQSGLAILVVAWCFLIGGLNARAVVGIDFGASNVRMGMWKSGVGRIEVVLNFESDRKTINAVGFRDGQTLFSQTAMNMVKAIDLNSFTNNTFLSVFLSISLFSLFLFFSFSHSISIVPKIPEKHLLSFEFDSGQVIRFRRSPAICSQFHSWTLSRPCTWHCFN